jgi:hypothetical protein
MRPLLALGVLGVSALLAAEIVLRVAGYGAPRWYEPDPHLGWALRPSVSGWFRDEGESFVTINSQGQHDREHALEKAADAYRIVVLGDAYSEAMQLPLEQSYWAQLPGRLHGCGFQPDKRIEVLNFGVRDYGTTQAVLVLQHKALRYRPDLVLLQFSHGNDVRDNSYVLDGKRLRPYFSLDAAGALQLDGSFASSAAYRRIASPAREALRTLVDRSSVLQLASRKQVVRSAHATGVAGLETETLAPPRDPLWADAWRITEALIERIGEAASRNGARVVLVPVPFAIEVHPDRALRERLQAQYGVEDFAYPERRLAGFARRIGMQAIELGPQMQAFAEESGAHLYGYANRRLGFGHWNGLGHWVAAELIARSLCASRDG